jgi:hypothetical protein
VNEVERAARQIEAVLAEMRQLSDQITTAYTSPEGRRAMQQSALLEYRCPKGCLLLHVWRSPAGLMFYQPPYKLSPSLNEVRSSPSGRAKNTLDGERRWRATAGVLDEYRGWGPDTTLGLNCHHLNHHEKTDALLEAADAATPGTPTRRVLT